MKKISLFLIFFLCSCDNSNANSVNRYPGHILTAAEFAGLNERRDRIALKGFLNVDPVRYEWCAAFVNASLRSNGIDGSESVSDYPLTARSFLQLGRGVDYPMIGDIIVFPRGSQPWQGHVGFFIETRIVNGAAYYVILGGNQNDEVNYKLYPANRAIGIRRVVQLSNL